MTPLVPWLKASEVTFAASIAVFIYVYSVLAPWWRNPVGRTIVWKDVCLLVLLLVGISNLWLHLPLVFSQWVYLFGVFGGSAIMFWRSAVFTHERYKALQASPEEVHERYQRLAEAPPATPPMPRTLRPFVAACCSVGRWYRRRWPG